MHRKLFGIALTAVLAVGLVACGSSSKSSSSSGPSADSADFGTMKNVCHSASGANKAKSDIGVTANSIQLTTISDAGSTLQPGLDQELWDASQVFVDWCNAHGGINGRTIQMLKGDTQLTQYDAVIKAACASSFALVGGGGVFDDLGQASRVGCHLPDYPGFVSSYAALGSSLVYQAVPTSNTELEVGTLDYLAKEYPGAINKVGFIFGNFPAVARINDQVKQVVTTELTPRWTQGKWPKNADNAGGNFEWTYSATGLASWVPVARAIRFAGLTSIVFNGQPTDLSKLVVALKVVGATSVKFIYSSANMYDQTVITGGGAALNDFPVYVGLHSVPFEVVRSPKSPATADQKAAVSDFLALFAKYLPTGKSKTLLGAQSFASWLLFTQAASSCGSDLTRQCLVDATAKVKNFDAGGLIVPNLHPDKNNIPRCFTTVRATSSGFTVAPDLGNTKGVFSCPSNVAVNTLLDNSAGRYGTPVSTLTSAQMQNLNK